MTTMKNNPGQIALIGWIREVMADQHDGKFCSAIACTHKEGNQDTEVYSVKFSDDKTWDAKDLAELFSRKAESHVAEIPGTQLFFLYAFYGDGGEPKGRRAFRINNNDVEFGYGGTEPPTPQGGLMQSMRHSENAYQFSMRHTQYLMDKQYGMIEMLVRQNTVLMRENVDALQVAKLTLLERAQFEAERMKEEGKKQMGLEFLKLLPPLVNKALGREVFPQSTADTKLIETVISKLGENDMEKLAGILPPELMGLIAARGAQYFEEKNRARALAESAVLSKKQVGNGQATDDDPESEFH